GLFVIINRATDSALLQVIALILETIAFIVIFLLLCVFPDGKFTPAWLRWLLIPYLLLVSVVVITLVGSGSIQILLYLLMVVFWLIGLYCQILRFRQTTSAVQRQQTKRIITGAAVAITGAGLAAIFSLTSSPGFWSAFKLLIGDPIFLDGG